MATINTQDVVKELNEYVKHNTEVVAAGVYSDEIQINKYCKTITAIKGKYPAFHKILTHVVQGFKAEWQELGEAEFKHKMLQNYRQKVNFAIIPDEILATWLAELYTEGKTKQELPISKHIMDDLMAKVIDDLDDLSQDAVYDAANADGIQKFNCSFAYRTWESEYIHKPKPFGGINVGSAALQAALDILRLGARNSNRAARVLGRLNNAVGKIERINKKTERIFGSDILGTLGIGD